ncbi:hypothetical protein EDB87DRAFT_1238863 [Lactarius vividus]|nr:hypothetical protein EDB87DRAFT_1238863 [Lactarius vividus]
MYRSILRVWTKNLWHFTREYNEPGSSVPLPSYVCITFTNPEMSRRIREHRDPTVCIIGRCIEALVVNKLAADINSRTIPARETELVCLSTILGTKSDNVALLLCNSGAIELTSVVFLALGDVGSSVTNKMPIDTLHVLQQTLNIAVRALPDELNAKMQLNHADTMNVSDGNSSFTVKNFKSVLRVCMKNLWHFTKEHNERGNSVSLPSYVCNAFANPEMTRRIHQDADLSTRMIGRCIAALVVNKLTRDAMSHTVPVSVAELACLSGILGTEIHDIRLCLSQPGTIELVNLAFLALGDVSSLRVDQILPDTRSVLQQTFDILSQALLARGNAELPLDQTIALITFSEDKFESTIASRLYGLLKMCITGASSLPEEVRKSCLRMCLKTLWCGGKAYHQTPYPLPSYFPLMFARPEITRHFQTEQDPVARITGRCFAALVVSKLVDALESPVSLSGRVRNPELACISAILGTEHREVLLLPHQLRIINFRNVISGMSGKIDTLFTDAGMPTDALDIARETLHILANRLRDCTFIPEGLPMDQRRLLQDIMSSLDCDQKNEKAKTLDRLREKLEQLLPPSQARV